MSNLRMYCLIKIGMPNLLILVMFAYRLRTSLERPYAALRPIWLQKYLGECLMMLSWLMFGV